MFLDCGEILKNRLWVGSYIRAEEVKLLRQLGITDVLSLQSEKDLENYRIPQDKLLKSYQLENIQFHRVPIIDFDRNSLSALISDGVQELEKAMLPNGARVYIHCTAGINRAPTIAAAYLIKVEGMSAYEAFNHVVARRRCSPYLEVLEQYERIIKGGHSRQES
jgi:protein-tyrosine phosphatase